MQTRSQTRGGYCTSTDNGEHKPITLEQAVTLLSQDPTEAKPVRLTFCGEPVNIVVYRSLIGEYTVAHEHGVESHLTVDSALKSAADIVNRLDIEYVQ